MRQPGDRIGRYVIVGLLGQGGMGEVYEAEDSLLGRRVALKLIVTGADAEMRERMLREARTAASFEHPNVVVVFDVGVVEDGANAEETFLAMELVRGKTLRSMVRDKAVPLVTKLRWLIDVARALDAAHAVHLVHRDIKPDNLMIRDDGQIKVLDFGIAKKKGTVDPSAPTGVSLDPQTLTKAGAIVGTPRYASPEQLRGDALDGRSDQYAWGVTAYELISGRTPFETDDPIALLSRVLSVEPAKLRTLDASIPEVVEAAIHRTMAKRAEDRFALLEEAAELLEPYAAAQAPSGDRRPRLSAAPVKTPAPARPSGTTNRRVVMLLVGIGIFVGAVIGAVKIRDARVPPPNAVSAAPAHGPLQCVEARVTGPGSSPELARMFGVGGCARLAVAIGEAWTHDKAVDRGIAATRRPVSVAATLGPRSTVTLTLGKEVASAESTSPLEAMQDAVKQLASRIPVPPMTEAERADWGASTDESARRIERFWRRLFMNDIKDSESEAKALVKSDPDSPWSYALLAIVSVWGSKTRVDAIHAMEARLDRVSGARQRGLRALALIQEGSFKDAIRELRKAYSDAPDDADIAGLYGAVATESVSFDEAFGVIERLAEQFPTHALLALGDAIRGAQREDLDRNGRYLARLTEVLPEFRCSGALGNHHLSKGELDAARALAAECVRFYGSASAEYGMDFDLARIALVAEDFDAAHAIGVKKLGDPRPSVRNGAAEVVIKSLLAAGRVAEAEDALRNEFARQRDEESTMVVLVHAATIIKLHRRLGMKPPADMVASLAAAIESQPLPLEGKLAFQGVLALAQGAPQKIDDVLSRMDELGNPSVDLMSLPMVRARKGNAAAAAIARQRPRASDATRRAVAIDAALALEATRADSHAIEEVLRYLKGPGRSAVELLDIAIGEAILARVCEAEGKHEEAKAHAAVVARRLAKADKGVAETIAKIR